MSGFDPISAGLSFVGDIAQSAFGHYNNRQDQIHQFDLNRQLRQTYFQDKVSSLKAAGLNPMLAIGAGMSSPGSVGLPSESSGHSGSSAVQAGIQAKASSSTRALQRQQSAVAFQQVQTQQAQQELLRSQSAKAAAEASQAEAQTNNLVAQHNGIVANSAAAAVNLHLAAGTLQSRTNSAFYQSLSDELSSRLMQLGLPAATASSNAARSYYGQHIQPYVIDSLRALGGAASAYSRFAPNRVIHSNR